MTVTVDKDMERGFAQLHEIGKRFLNGSLSSLQARSPLQDIIEGKFPQREFVIPGITVAELTVGEMVAHVEAANQEFDWGFKKRDFEKLPDPPQITEEHGALPVLVLVPYLDTVEATLDGLWQWVVSVHPGQYRGPLMQSDPEHLRLLEGIEHPGKCLRWEIIDLAANWDGQEGVAPETVRDPETSPHAGVLAAAALFPKWVQSMNGKQVPYVWLPGYQVNVGGSDPSRDVPYLYWNLVSRRVELDANWDDYPDPLYAVPVLRGVQH